MKRTLCGEARLASVTSDFVCVRVIFLSRLCCLVAWLACWGLIADVCNALCKCLFDPMLAGHVTSLRRVVAVQK